MTEALLTLSASKLKTFSSCPKKYWYTYIKKDEVEKHPAAALGSAVHKTIERVCKEQGQPLVIFGEEYIRQIRENDLTVDTRLYNDGIQMVSNYNFDRRVPQEIELEFRLAFPNQAHPMCYIHGFLDQLYDWGFVDLKTNKRKPLHGVLDNDLQFIVYSWAFKELTGYEPDAAIWHHLRTSEDLEADVFNKVDSAQRVIERILDSEITGIYDKNIGDACLFCSHKESCLGRRD